MEKKLLSGKQMNLSKHFMARKKVSSHRKHHTSFLCARPLMLVGCAPQQWFTEQVVITPCQASMSRAVENPTSYYFERMSLKNKMYTL
jgi:hypothetical protein